MYFGDTGANREIFDGTTDPRLIDNVIAAAALPPTSAVNSAYNDAFVGRFGINPADSRINAFYERMAEAGLPLICHTGGEHTVRVLDKDLNGIRPLVRPLDIGVQVVAAHSGTRSGFLDEDHFDEFVALARRWPNLYGDLSAWSVPNRARHYPRLMRSGIDWRQVLHGSDYPVPLPADPR